MTLLKVYYMTDHHNPQDYMFLELFTLEHLNGYYKSLSC